MSAVGRKPPPPELVERIVAARLRFQRSSVNALAKRLGLGREQVTRALVLAGLHPPRRSRMERGESA